MVMILSIVKMNNTMLISYTCLVLHNETLEDLITFEHGTEKVFPITNFLRLVKI